MIPPEYKYLDIVFENCNGITIIPEHIEGFYIGEITYGLWANFCGQYSKNKACKYVQITLKNEALLTKTWFESKHGITGSDSFEDHLNDYSDITNVGIVDLKDNEEYICVPWGGDDQFKNDSVKVEYEEDCFTITIEDREEK